MNVFLNAKPFPDFIIGDSLFLQILHSEDDDTISELVNMIKRNKDFSEYLDLSHYKNIKSAKKVIEKREEFAKNGLIGDYAIQLFTGKIVGGIKFVNMGDKSVSVAYYIDKQYRGMGFVSKSLKLFEPELAKIGFNKIVLEIHESNENSMRVARKNNYTYKETGYPMKDFVKNLNVSVM